MSESKVPKWRKVVAGFALTAVLGLGVIAVIPRDDVPQADIADAVAGHDHTADAGSTESAPVIADPVVGEPIVPPGEVIDADAVVESTLGTQEESSLQAAASTPGSATRDAETLPGARGDIDPAALLAESSESLGGCLSEYGQTGQCLPVVPPSLSAHLQSMVDAGLDPQSMPHQWGCDEVRAYFRAGIDVRQPGVDPQGLDRDADGVACGPND